MFHGTSGGTGVVRLQALWRFGAVDVGIAHGGRVLRVQIKSTTYSRDGSFICTVLGPGHRGYRKGEVDFVAVYVVPVDVWYILPFEAKGNCVVATSSGEEGEQICEIHGGLAFAEGRELEGSSQAAVRRVANRGLIAPGPGLSGRYLLVNAQSSGALAGTL